jgi:hypothetical protein
VRTVYRYLEPGLQYVDVTIGPWVATFAFADEREPWRVSRWRPE